MNGDQSFLRLAAVTSILAALLAFGNMTLSLIALFPLVANYNIHVFDHPDAMLSIGASGASLLRWAMIFDVFGYYLLLAPLALFLWNWLKPKSNALVTLYTFCGLAYMLIGAMGAATLAAVWPPLIEGYGHASAQQREILVVVFSGFTNAVYVGLWNLLESSLAAIWWLGIGLALRRERPVLGIFTVVLGSFMLLDAIGRILNVETIYIVGLSGALLLIPIWALWFGIDLLRRSTI